MNRELERALVHAGRRLPAGQLETIAAAFDRHPSASDGARLDVMHAAPLARVRDLVQPLVTAWPSDLPGTAIALALRAAGTAAREVGEEEVVDIVWTGPASPEVPVRRTLAVVTEVIRAARARLTLVSFAAYKVADVVTELRSAVDRGVDVRLILETEKDSGEALSFDAAAAFTSLGSAVSFWVWPAELRPATERRRVSQHAKASLADDCLAFITSANLTGQAMLDNMELGVLVRGGSVPRRLDVHFQQLMDNGVLRNVRE